jgi:hypothetical protein
MAMSCWSAELLGSCSLARLAGSFFCWRAAINASAAITAVSIGVSVSIVESLGKNSTVSKIRSDHVFLK